MTLRDPISLDELRRVLKKKLKPSRLVIRREHDGALMLRIVSKVFEENDAPLHSLKDLLAKEGLKLPDRTLTLLRSPSDLEDEFDTEKALFEDSWRGTPTWADALLREVEEPTPKDDRNFAAKVIAFWGLKGGVGRSTALAYVAAIVGQRHRILAVDLDIDSPALVATLTQGAQSERPRIEDLIRDAATLPASEGEMLRSKIRLALRKVDDLRKVDVLGPDIVDEPYVLSLLGPLAVSTLYRGAGAIRRLIREAIVATEAELVFLDCRSGYCDESAMAVLDLADEVVIFASPAPSNFPSLKPAVTALEKSRLLLGRPSLHFVAGMLPAGLEARERILSSLPVVIGEALGTLSGETREAPGKEDLVAIDYSPRIVENEGTLLPSALTGYSELAARISPPPSKAMFSTVKPETVKTILLEARIPQPQAEDEPDAQLDDLFTETAALAQFARPETMLILGAKGTGKSFLHRFCLRHKDALSRKQGASSLANFNFVDGYSQLKGASKPRITPIQLQQIAGRFPLWRDVWSAIALARTIAYIREQGHSLVIFPGSRLARSIDALVANGTTAESADIALLEIQRLANDPSTLNSAWDGLDDWCESTQTQIVLLFDDLDIALGDSAAAIDQRKLMIRGLLEAWEVSWKSSRHIGVKIFLREDIFRSLRLEEEAKFESRKVDLLWQPVDLWRFMLRAMASASPTFKHELEERGLLLGTLETWADEDLDAALEFLWGQRIAVSKTRSKTWAFNRLSDSKGRLFPRAALWLLQYAIEERKLHLEDKPELPLLDGKSLRNAMPRVATARLAELRAESSTTEKELLGRLKGFGSYMNEVEFLDLLRKTGEPQPLDALRTLEDLGVIARGARQDKTPTVKIVDLYAFASDLAITRLGQR